MFFLSSFLILSLCSCVSTGKQRWLLAIGRHSPHLEAVQKALLLPSAAAASSAPLPHAGPAASVAPWQNHSGEGQAQHILPLPLQSWGPALTEQAMVAKAMPWPADCPGSHSCWRYSRACAGHICAIVVTYSRAGLHRASAAHV